MSRSWRIAPRLESDLRRHLLSGRGLQSLKAQQEFLNPVSPESLLESPENFGLGPDDLTAAAARVKAAIVSERPIVIHGDYDVDGLCATAILWKTIYQDLNYKNCQPFIPNRFDHGYGLSRSSIDSVINLTNFGDLGYLKPLLITVDCGLTAFDSVEYAKEKGFEVLVIDHHAPPEKRPDCQILWTDKICAGGLSWVLSRALIQGHAWRDSGSRRAPAPVSTRSSRGGGQTPGVREMRGLMELAALATIADLQPLTGFNRSLVKFGLEGLNRTVNLGLKTLLKVAGVEDRKIGPFEVGWIIAPRLNAAGRLENALDSLRLLCTHDSSQAETIAKKLNQINSDRQELTRSMVALAIDQIHNSKYPISNSKFAVAIHEEFHEGIIGLVAGKLVQEYGTPAVVISRGAEFSKASARSVNGFNIIEFLRSLGDLFEDIGGHSGAAGFTLRTDKIDSFISSIINHQSSINLPEVTLSIDAEIGFDDLSLETLDELKSFEPFGLGNPEPVFLLKDVLVSEARTVGSQNQHLRLRVTSVKRSASSKETGEEMFLNANRSTLSPDALDCIGFDLGDRLDEIKIGEKVDLVFSLSEDNFSGRRKLSLKLKDFRKSESD